MDGFTVRNSNRFLETGKMLGETNGLNRGAFEKGMSGIGEKGLGTSDGNIDGVQKSFAATLNEAIQNVNKLQQDSNIAAQNLATGRTDNVAEVMIASEKADIAIRLMMQVRNKIIDAYQEVMKMQV